MCLQLKSSSNVNLTLSLLINLYLFEKLIYNSIWAPELIIVKTSEYRKRHVPKLKSFILLVFFTQD